jgi:hypothetical protein
MRDAPRRWRTDGRIVLAAAVLLAIAGGCDGGAAPPTGAARLAIAGTPVADVTAVVVTISGPDFAPMAEPLAEADGGWSAFVTTIPCGPARRFDAVAYDASGTAVYRGSSASDVAAGAVVDVSILLEASPAGPFDNSAPVIDSFWASQILVPTSGAVQLGIDAHDPDPADVLSYRWDATCGSFDDALAPQVTWTAPAAAAACAVSVTVSDTNGASVTTSVVLDVS